MSKAPSVRTCNLCEAQKAIEEFRQTKHKQYVGYKHTCLSCESVKNKARNAEYYTKNRDKCLAKAKEKYQPRERKPRVRKAKTTPNTPDVLPEVEPHDKVPVLVLQPIGIQLYENYTEPVIPPVEMEVQL